VIDHLGLDAKLHADRFRELRDDLRVVRGRRIARVDETNEVLRGA
jgi:hypothetical protein